MLLTMRDVAYYVENQEWPATLNQWRPCPGVRPAAMALAEIRRRSLLLYLAIAPATVAVLCASLIAAFGLGHFVDASGGWIIFSVVALLVISCATFATLMLYRTRATNTAHRERIEMVQTFISTIALCLSALDLDIHSAILEDEQCLKEAVDGFLLAQGMEVVAYEVAGHIVAGLSAKNLAKANQLTAHQRLAVWVEKFTNLMLLAKGTKADDYVARGRQALVNAGRPEAVPAPVISDRTPIASN